MADFEEDSVFTEGVRAFEATDPARFDVLNNTIKPLVDRTRYLYDNGDAALRNDLSNPDKGAAMVARGVVAVPDMDTLSALPAAMLGSDKRYLVQGAAFSYETLTGSFIFNSEPAAGSPLGWRCIESGNPGVWEAISLGGSA